MKSLLITFLAAFALTGCVGAGVERPEINSVSDAIIVTAADIESLADEIRVSCGNAVPDAPCIEGGIITTGFRDDAKTALRDAVEGLRTANRLLAAGEGVDADDRLSQVRNILLTLRAELEALQ